MKLNTLKAQVIKRIVICSVVTGVFVAIAIATQLMLNKSESDEKKLSTEINQIRSKTSAAKKDFQFLQKAAEKFHNTPEHKLPSKKGFITPQERIRALTPILSDIKTKYSLSEVKYSFTEKPKTDTNLKLKYTTIYSGDITFNIQSLTDEIIYAVIDELSNRLPGYIQINNITINKKRSFSQTFLNDIKSNNKDVTATEGKIKIVWYTLKTIENKDNQDKR